MAESRKRFFAILIALIMIAMAFPFMPGRAAHAFSDFALDTDHVEFYKGSEDVADIRIGSDSYNIDPDTVNVADESIATAKAGSNYIYVYPKGVGKTTLTVTAVDGVSTLTVEITVDADFFQGILENNTYLNNCWYGTKKIYVVSEPGVEGTVKIEGKTYDFTVGSSGKAKIKLKKIYPLNTKVSVKAKWHGFTYKFKAELKSETSVNYAKASKKKIVIDVDNAHKGDIVKFTYAGKTYTKKITKDKDNKITKITFKTKKKIAKNGKVVFTILNKNKKTLCKIKTKLDQGIYMPEDESIYDDTYDDD